MALGLTCGHYHEAKSFADFYIEITLSKKGLKEWEEVTKRVIYMIRNIQTQPVNKIFFEECQRIAELKFDYKNKEDPFDYTTESSPNIFLYELEDILSGAYLINEYNEGLIKETLNMLTCENMNIYLTSQDFAKEECNLSEEIYGTPFCKQKFGEVTTKTFKQEVKDIVLSCNYVLDYPPQNNFIPKSFDIKKLEKENKYPVLIRNDENVVWFKQDNTFKLPKTLVILQVYFNSLEYMLKSKKIRNLIFYFILFYSILIPFSLYNLYPFISILSILLNQTSFLI